MKYVIRRNILPTPDIPHVSIKLRLLGKTNQKHFLIIFYFCPYQGGRDEQTN